MRAAIIRFKLSHIFDSPILAFFLTRELADEFLNC